MARSSIRKRPLHCRAGLFLLLSLCGTQLPIPVQAETVVDQQIRTPLCPKGTGDLPGTTDPLDPTKRIDGSSAADEDACALERSIRLLEELSRFESVDDPVHSEQDLRPRQLGEPLSIGPNV